MQRWKPPPSGAGGQISQRDVPTLSLTVVPAPGGRDGVTAEVPPHGLASFAYVPLLRRFTKGVAPKSSAFSLLFFLQLGESASLRAFLSPRQRGEQSVGPDERQHPGWYPEMASPSPLSPHGPLRSHGETSALVFRHTQLAQNTEQMCFSIILITLFT